MDYRMLTQPHKVTNPQGNQTLYNCGWLIISHPPYLYRQFLTSTSIQSLITSTSKCLSHYKPQTTKQKSGRRRNSPPPKTSSKPHVPTTTVPQNKSFKAPSPIPWMAITSLRPRMASFMLSITHTATITTSQSAQTMSGLPS